MLDFVFVFLTLYCSHEYSHFFFLFTAVQSQLHHVFPPVTVVGSGSKYSKYNCCSGHENQLWSTSQEVVAHLCLSRIKEHQAYSCQKFHQSSVVSGLSEQCGLNSLRIKAELHKS